MKNGFTLLELSIVLVIIGLIIGGITVGADLIRAAELNSVVSDFNKFRLATSTFKLKYNALPGDMDNATAYWGKDNTNCAGHSGTAATPGTCNGNGDGKPIWSSEAHRAWQHLTLSEILPGNYTGLNSSTLGVDVPESQIDGGGYLMLHWLSSYGASDVTREELTIEFGKPTADGDVRGAILNAPETHGLDNKIDDGLPATGNFLVREIDNDCAVSATNSYSLNETDIACTILYYF